VEEPEDYLPLGNKIVAFVLTLIAIPFLFVLTCVPVGFVALFGQPAIVPIIVFSVYGVAFVGFAIYRAVRTENPGIRWGIIVALAAGVLCYAMIVLPNLLGR
jgi:hypothetical protein